MNKLKLLILTLLIIFLMCGCGSIRHKEYSFEKRETSEVKPLIISDEALNSSFEIPEDFAEDSYEDYDYTIEDEHDEDTEPSLDNKYIEEFALLAPTTLMSFEELVGDNGIYDYPEGFLKPDTYKIIVDKYYQVVMVYKADSNGEYTIPVRYMLCTTGASGSPTPSGTFNMKSYRVRYALFNNTDVYGQYWSLITGRIYFHSILYSNKDASTYTESSYNNLGKHVSHGCVRLSVPDARWIWYNAAPGTCVVIRDGSSSDKETALIRDQLKLAPLPKVRPKSMTGDIPYTDNWRVEDIPHDVEFIQGNQ